MSSLTTAALINDSSYLSKFDVTEQEARMSPVAPLARGTTNTRILPLALAPQGGATMFCFGITIFELCSSRHFFSLSRDLRSHIKMESDLLKALAEAASTELPDKVRTFHFL